MTLTWTTIEVVDRLSPTPPRLGDFLKTERAQVFGGWLVRTYMMRRESAQVPGSVIEPEFDANVAMTFVPDPAWAWKP